MARMLEASAPALAKPLQPKTEQAMSKLKLKLSYAGFRSEAAPQIFLSIKVRHADDRRGRSAAAPPSP